MSNAERTRPLASAALSTPVICGVIVGAVQAASPLGF